MATSAVLSVIFQGDASGLNKTLDQVEKKASGLSGIFSKATGALGSLGLAGMGVSVITGAVENVTDSFMGLISSAESLGDAGARVGAVWGEEMKGVIEDNATIANSLGMTKTAYLSNVGALGQLTKSLGVNTDAGADMAMEFTELAPKLAAYAGVEADVAKSALESALLGKTKGLAALGIAITDADKAASAMRLGIQGEAKDWTEAEVAQINYAAAMDKTLAAQEAWAGNSGDVEVSMQRITAAMDDAKAAIGERLLPIIAPLVQSFADKLPGAIDTFMGVVGPVFDTVSGWIDKLSTVVWALVGAFQAVGSNANFGGILDGTPFEGFSDILKTTEGILTDLGKAWRAFLDGMAESDADGVFGQVMDGLRAIGGDDIAGALENVKVAFEKIWGALKEVDWEGVIGIGIQFIKDLKDGAELLWPKIQLVAEWIGDKLKKAIENVWPKLQELRDWMIEHKGIVAGVTGAIMILAGGPMTALIGAVALLGAAWRENWGGIREHTESFVNWFSANVTPVIESVISKVQDSIGAMSQWWKENGDKVIAVVSWMWSYVQSLFSAGFTVISGIVEGALALLRGDWSGFGEALGKIAAGIVNLVANVFKGTYTATKAVLVWVWDQLKTLFSGEGRKAGESVLDGIKRGITEGASKVYGALKDLASGMIKGFMENIDAHSPSRIFAEIATYITAGLASGIQKTDQKAIAALADVVSKMVSTASGLADFGKKIAEMVVPSDQQIQAAKEKYLRMTMILTDFIKSVSYLGSLLPVANKSKAEPGQIRAINAGLTQLSQSFPAIRELQGMTADKLLTGGEADWAGRLADTVGKIAGVWGGIADSMTKIADAKFPSDSQLDAVKAATLKIATWAIGVFDQDMIPAAGAEDFAKSIKAMVDAFSAVASAKLDDVTRLGADALQTAKDNIVDMWVGFAQISKVFRELDAKTQGEIVDGFARFGAAVRAATDAITAGAMSKFEGATRLGAETIQTAKDSIVEMWLGVAEISKVFRGLDTDLQQGIVDGFKRFSDAVGAVVGIVKASEIGEIVPALSIQVDSLKRVLTFIRDDIAPAIQDIAGAWTLGLEAADRAIESMKQFGDWIKAAVDIAKATVIGQLEANILVNRDTMLRILEWLRDDFVPAIQDIVGWWSLGSDAAKAATAGMKEFSEWISAAVAVAKATVIGELHANILVNFDVMEAILVWLRDKFVPMVADAVGQWSLISDGFRSGVDNMKDFAEWVNAAVDIAKATVIGELHANILVNFDVMKAILVWLRDTFVPAIAEVADQWGQTSESAKPMIDQMQAFAKVIDAAVDIAKATDVGSLVTATDPSKLAAHLENVKQNALAIFAILGDIAQDISVKEAEARAALATAIGGVGAGLGQFGDGIGSLMELAQSKLFGSSSSRGGLGHTQRTRTNRADFFAQQMTDTIKRAVGAVQDALNGITLTVDDKKVAALTALGAAFGSIADGLTKLAEAKMPGAKQLADIMAALAGAQGLFGSAGGGGSTGGGQGGGAQGSSGAASSISDAFAAQIKLALDGWNKDEKCTVPIRESIARQIVGAVDGWNKDEKCSIPIRDSISRQIVGAVDGWNKDEKCGVPIREAFSSIIAAALGGGGGGAGLAFASAGGQSGAGGTVTNYLGDTYLQYGNNVIVTDADDQAGLIEALKASIR